MVASTVIAIEQKSDKRERDLKRIDNSKLLKKAPFLSFV